MNKRRFMICAVLTAAILVYLNSLWNGFAYDDAWIVESNPHVHNLRDLRGIFLTPYWPTYGVELGLYRPMAIFMYAIEWSISGGAPWVFHLVNVLVHATVSLLVFLFIERLTNSRAGLAGALLFAVHPVHTEAVANVVGQGELWAALGVMAACVLYVTRPDGVEIPWGRRVAVLGLYAFAMLAKESAVVLPGLLVLLDFAQQRVRLAKHDLLRYGHAVGFTLVMCSAVVVAYIALRVDVLGNFAGVDAGPGLPFLRETHRVLNAFRAWPEYVRLLFFPLDLSVDYSPGVILPVESITPMLLLGVLLSVGSLGLMLAAPWRPMAGLVAGWFLISILPVSNFLFPIGVLVAERTLYLPSVAVCVLAAFAWDAFRAPANSQRARQWALTGGLALLVLFGIRTVIRNPDWRSLKTVFRALRRDHPESYRAQWVNATDMSMSGNAKLAEQYFLIAHRMWPRDSQLLTDIGSFYVGENQYEKAVVFLEQSRAMTPFVIHTAESLAYAYVYANRPHDALAEAARSVKLRMGPSTLTYTVMAGAYDKLGRYDDAAGAWRAASKRRNGNIWLYWSMLARSLASAGRVDAALAAADTAHLRTGNFVPLREVVDTLKTHIRSGCYPKGGDCDVLRHFTIMIAKPAPVLANSQATAKSNGVPGLPPGLNIPVESRR